MADWLPQCKFLMFDPTPASGPHDYINLDAVPGRTYRGQLMQSGQERHQNIYMMHLGIAETDRIGRFNSHFVKPDGGIETAFMSLHSALTLFSREHHQQQSLPNSSQRAVETFPTYLKLDIEGYEFNGMIDQLVTDARVQQLSIDFHSTDLAQIKYALLQFHAAGYDMVGGFDDYTVRDERLFLHVSFLLTRERCLHSPPLAADFMENLRMDGTCFFRDAFVTGGAGQNLAGTHSAATAQTCQDHCAAHPDCVAFTFVETLLESPADAKRTAASPKHAQRCQLLEVKKNKLGERLDSLFGIRSRRGSICGPRVCPTYSRTDVIEP